MEPTIEEKIEHDLFDASILIKGLHAVTELVGGVFTLLVSPNFIIRILKRMTLGELLEDPNDKFTHYLLHSASTFSVGTKQFIAYYLISHGIVNLVLVIGLFRKKIWAYHASFIALTIFAVYQLYRYQYSQSIWLIVLTVFDFIVIFLIWKEYKVISKVA